MTALSQFSAEQLAKELSARTDLEKFVDEHGRVPGFVYSMLTKWTPMPFVDGFAVRRRGDEYKMGLIERGTGHEAGKLAFVGGKNGQDETFEQSFLYQWEADLGLNVRLIPGLEWFDPLDTQQYMRRNPTLPDGSIPAGLGFDKGKNSRSHVYAVMLPKDAEVRFGSKTNDIGNEAREFVWINPLASDPSDWGYPGMYHSALRAWSKMIDGIRRGKYSIY